MFVMNEYYKEKIGFYKLLLTLLTTAFLGTFGWFFTNYRELFVIDIILSIIGLILIFSFILACIFKIRVYTNKLKKE